MAEEKPNVPQAQDSMELTKKMLETRTILLCGEINKELAERVIKQLLLLEAANKETIKLFIDSPGGDADAGFAIYDMIRFIDVPVITIGMGLIASAASIVLIAVPAENRLSLPNAHYMIHQPLSNIRGVASDIEIHAMEIEKLRKKANKLYAKETGQDEEKVSMDTDRNFWLDAQEAKAYGLVSRIIKKRKDIK
ncbi:MAG: ATP-dependent Clp protease proteolytic subunit [Spirochaetaceae bacterium]|nr:ATP-dependent Clp protease proteolytic subunit [Spirochaetaceae bacterium]